MLISTKGRYALRVMIDLAEHQTEEFISLKGIAQRQEISEKYLESIIRTLVKAKILESLRGKGGGYRLKKSPEQYTVGSILRLTEESLVPVACLELFMESIQHSRPKENVGGQIISVIHKRLVSLPRSPWISMEWYIFHKKPFSTKNPKKTLYDSTYSVVVLL